MTRKDGPRSLNIRVPSNVAHWLETRARDNNRSVASVILTTILEKMREEPLRIVIREFIAPTETRYLAAWGETIDDFANEATEEALFEKIKMEIEGRGCQLREVEFDQRQERVGFGPKKDTSGHGN